MRKSLIATITVVAFIAVAALFSMAWAQKTASGEVADVIEIKDEIFKTYKQGPVSFTHMKHSVDYKLKCTDCHHGDTGSANNTWKEGDPVKKCSACHGLKKEGKVDKLEKAFHDNCRTCHKDYNTAQGTKAAPTVCKDCHAKK